MPKKGPSTPPLTCYVCGNPANCNHVTYADQNDGAIQPLAPLCCACFCNHEAQRALAHKQFKEMQTMKRP
jgi:hypothetical protein